MSASAAVRARAARIVADVALRGRSLDVVLTHDPAATRQERGLLRALCYDSIRWYPRLDALLSRLLSRPGQTLEPEIRTLAIVGLCQLLYTDIPAHAAVAETVAATRLLRQPRAAGLVNAILRRCQREHEDLLARIDANPALRYAHPQWLLDKVQADWGEHAEAILEANNRRPPLWLRVNRRHKDAANYSQRLQAAGIEVDASLFDGTALRLQRAVDVTELPGFAEGHASVQDAAAQLATHLLAPESGERVLDACAAPGGKTGHLLERTESLEVVALDVAGERLVRVEQNLKRLQLQAQVLTGDALQPQDWWDGQPFHRILLDVPCSATGVIRRHPDIKLLRRADDIAVLAERQSQLLRALWPLLRPGGRMLYASCSVLWEETGAVVAAFLAGQAEASDATAAALSPLAAALPDLVASRGPAGDGPGLRIATGVHAMDGFYYALLEKTKDAAWP